METWNRHLAVARMKELGLKPKDVALALEYEPSSFSQYLYSTSKKPSHKKLMKLAKILRVNVNRFYLSLDLAS